MDKSDTKEMLALFEQMQKMGTEFFVDGEPMLPNEAVTKAVEEESVYMADYVVGDTGRVEQIRFDKINLL
ncbi:MAG: hypothetical protein ACI4R5_01800 [Acetatifactor sp.]